MRFFGRLLLVLLVGGVLVNVGLAQPVPTKKKDGGGALEELDRKAPKRPEPKPEPEPEVAESTDEAAKPDQSYEEIAVDESLKKNLNRVNAILMAGKFGAGDQAVFDDFYEKYFLPRWTVVKNIAFVPDYRRQLRNSHLGRRSANQEVHDHLNSLLLAFMKNLAAGPYHPAVHVNAMLMIGDLNGIETPPTPLPEALDVMLAAVQNAKLSAAVRAAAMVGISRHVAAGLRDDDTRKTLAASMLKLASADLPTGADAASGEWLLAQSIDILGRLGSLGENNAVFTIMVKTASNAKLSFSTRAIAAESLGRLNYSGASDINPVEIAAMLGQFAIDACTEELRLVKETGYPVSRRRMKQRLNAALMALAGGEEETRKGIAPLAREQGKKAFLADLQKLIEGMIQIIDDKRRENDDLETPVDEFRGKLEAWLKKKPK